MWKCRLKIRFTNCNPDHFNARVFGVFTRIRQILVFYCLVIFLVISPAAESQSIEEPTNWYGYLYLGDNIGGSSTGKLESVDYKSGGPPEWGIGIGRYLNNVVSLEGTFEYWGERYNRTGGPVIAGTENNVIQVGGLGLSVTAVVNYSHQDLHGYAGIGAGYFLTGILVTEPGTGLLTGKGAPSDKLLLGFHVSIGADYRIQQAHRIAIELKRRFLKADFGQYTNGTVDVGGTYLLFMYRHSWK